VLTVGNETQIAAANSQFRELHGAALARLFARMQGLVEEAILSEATGVLANA
jgi:hypothetical protein